MRSAVVGILLLALCGCAGTSTNIDVTQLSDMRKGQTTVAEVLKKFGRPSLLSKNWDGTQTAAYASANGDATGPSLLPAMGAVMGGASASRDTVVFYFDTSGILTDYKATPASTPSSTGTTEPTRASQPVGSVPTRKTADESVTNKPANPEPARASPARKSSDGLPSWLPSDSRDVRQ